MRIVRLLICTGYWALLTLVLLVPNPAAVVGLPKIPRLPWGDIGFHFSAFVILAVIIHAARWPQLGSRLIIVVLLVYGVVTELLQALVPLRAVEGVDCIENTLGILVGTGLYWLGQVVTRSRCRLPRENRQPKCEVPLAESGLASSAASSHV